MLWDWFFYSLSALIGVLFQKGAYFLSTMRPVPIHLFILSDFFPSFPTPPLFQAWWTSSAGYVAGPEPSLGRCWSPLGGGVRPNRFVHRYRLPLRLNSAVHPGDVCFSQKHYYPYTTSHRSSMVWTCRKCFDPTTNEQTNKRHHDTTIISTQGCGVDEF